MPFPGCRGRTCAPMDAALRLSFCYDNPGYDGQCVTGNAFSRMPFPVGQGQKKAFRAQKSAKNGCFGLFFARKSHFFCAKKAVAVRCAFGRGAQSGEKWSAVRGGAGLFRPFDGPVRGHSASIPAGKADKDGRSGCQGKRRTAFPSGLAVRAVGGGRRPCVSEWTERPTACFPEDARDSVIRKSSDPGEETDDSPGAGTYVLSDVRISSCCAVPGRTP